MNRKIGANISSIIISSLFLALLSTNSIARPWFPKNEKDNAYTIKLRGYYEAGQWGEIYKDMIPYIMCDDVDAMFDLSTFLITGYEFGIPMKSEADGARLGVEVMRYLAYLGHNQESASLLRGIYPFGHFGVAVDKELGECWNEVATDYPGRYTKCMEMEKARGLVATDPRTLFSKDQKPADCRPYR